MSSSASGEQALRYLHLGDVAEITMGQSPDSANLNTNEEGLLFLQGCAESGRKSPLSTIYCNPALRLSKPESILISVRAPVGTLNWGDQSYCIGRGLAAIRATENAETGFLFYAIAQNSNFLHRRSQGSTFLAIGGNDLKIFPVPDFDVNKQQKIARILQTIDRAIEQTEVLIDKHQQIKAGLMHDLFTRGIGPDGQLRPPRDQAPHLYQQTPIGWIPKEWDYKTLKDIFGPRNITNGPFGSDLLTSELKKEGVPVLYCQDVKPGFFERVSCSNVTQQKAAQLSFCNVRKGDILLAKVGTPPCDSCVYSEEEPAVVTQDVIRIRTGEKHFSGFFSNWFNTGFGRKSVKKISIEGTRERVSLGEFKELLLPVPEFNEQYEIESRIRTLQDSLVSSKKELNKLKKQKSGLMHDLLTGKVPVTPDPEPAHG